MKTLPGIHAVIFNVQHPPRTDVSMRGHRSIVRSRCLITGK